MAYRVYREWRHKRATVHDGDCGYCRHGQGFRKNTGSESGKWHSPFDNVFHALNAAVLLHPGYYKVHTCASGPYGSRERPEPRRENLGTKRDIEEILQQDAQQQEAQRQQQYGQNRQRPPTPAASWKVPPSILDVLPPKEPGRGRRRRR